MAGNINDCLADTNCIGMVENVDTRKVVVGVENEGVLNTLKINDIVVLGGSNSDEKLIGILTKVTKKKVEFDETEQTEDLLYSNNCCVVNLVGSFYNKYGAGSENKFKRAINTYPEINSKVYQANEAAMQMIMNAVRGKAAESKSLEIGHFASNKDVAAILDDNRFFQRHACIVGSTGSGKSYTVASVLEKANQLPYANMVVFDLHGEYNELSYADQIKIVYTPLHGTGNIPARRIMKEIGFENVYVVPEQELPDGEFPTVSYPNPESDEAFVLGLELAKKVDADLVLATDPDADRLGVRVKDREGIYHTLTGNMSGCLLADYTISQIKEKQGLPKDGALIKTIVTTNMADAIAKYYNVNLIECLTGFKYIGQQILKFETMGVGTYLFGFEESYGCLIGTHARD